MKRRLFVLLNRFVNVLVTRIRPKTFRGGRLLVLTTTGRKTGKSRRTPLLFLEDGERWVVVASNGGADWEPGWWLNLRAGGTGTLEVDGSTATVTGTEIQDPERASVWARLLDEVFDYDSYQRQVSRRIAVVSLDRVREHAGL